MERVSLTWDVRNWITISLMALILWFGIGAVMSFLRPTDLAHNVGEDLASEEG